MNGSRFESLVQSVFKPFLSDLNFEMEPIHVSGKYYRASFVDHRYKLAVSFEPGEEIVTVTLGTIGTHDIQPIDDPARSPRLSTLNARYMALVTSKERADNEVFFGQVQALDQIEHALIKCAKELRLVLPHHLSA